LGKQLFFVLFRMENIKLSPDFQFILNIIIIFILILGFIVQYKQGNIKTLSDIQALEVGMKIHKIWITLIVPRVVQVELLIVIISLAFPWPLWVQHKILDTFHLNVLNLTYLSLLLMINILRLISLVQLLFFLL